MFLDTPTKLCIVGLVILSTAFHEMAHAFTAYWLGDPTPGRYGRLTLNPIPHLQPVFTAIILPVLMFIGSGGFMILAQTPIDPTRFRHPLRDHALVAVVGPLMNVVCGLAMIGILWIPGVVVLDGTPKLTYIVLSFAALFNFIMAVFNLLPIPPLDGYWIIRAVLPLQMRAMGDRLARSQASFIVVMLVGSVLIGFFNEAIGRFWAALLPRMG